MRGQTARSGRPQPGAGAAQLGGVDAQADQHQGRPRGGQLDGHRDLDIQLGAEYVFSFRKLE